MDSSTTVTVALTATLIMGVLRMGGLQKMHDWVVSHVWGGNPAASSGAPHGNPAASSGAPPVDPNSWEGRALGVVKGLLPHINPLLGPVANAIPTNYAPPAQVPIPSGTSSVPAPGTQTI